MHVAQAECTEVPAGTTLTRVTGLDTTESYERWAEGFGCCNTAKTIQLLENMVILPAVLTTATGIRRI
jgi:hypothetical protein